MKDHQLHAEPSMNLPSLDHTSPSYQQWVTPEMGLNSTMGKGNPRLGRGYKVSRNREGFPRISLTSIAYSPSFPTFLSHPREVFPFSCSTVLQLPHFPSRASTTGRTGSLRELQACREAPSEKITSPTTSLTWREFLIGLTTCFFNPMGLTTCLFYSTHWMMSHELGEGSTENS
jgi:hypothetical protein